MWKLRRNRRLTPTALQTLQEKKLRALVRHSYHHVPYYHRLFKQAGLHPDAITTVDDVRKIPVTTKDDIRFLPSHELTAQNIDLTTCSQSHTSGSTGVTLTVYWDRDYRIATKARKLVTDLVCGDSMWYRRAVFTQWEQEQPRLYHKFGLFRTRYISPFKDLYGQFNELTAFNPQTIFTLPSHALSLTRVVKEQGLQNLDVKLIISQGELLDAYTRRVVEDTLGAEMFDRYGSAEAPRIYAECRDHSCHIQSDRHLVNVTRNGETLGRAEEGDITVTNLDNYVMPFIRYNQEDIGLLLNDICTCECHYPLMRITTGRNRDYIQLPDGRIIPGNHALLFLRSIPGIAQFQVVQEQRDRLRVILVKGDDFQETLYGTIAQEFHRLIGADVAIEFTIVDAIPRGRTGKLLAFKTYLPVNPD
jgi:phenylacetate-CoA ligase